ncbi:uracil-DNA glycosylase-like protein [Mycena maculata]|uniref:Uracil-DNA glycosylase-like protein n=1 Tax=Mycena maculata TaxID=230809 RepID=A0AAD7MLH8_9AGAR|nr:uracil-DNA glycosylase-like protein [Mycena maculata]
MADAIVYLEDIQDTPTPTPTPKSKLPSKEGDTQVYLEDLAVPVRPQKTPLAVFNTNSTNLKSKAATATGGKRQRTLFDMQFSEGGGGAKRAKVGTGTAVAARFMASSAGVATTGESEAATAPRVLAAPTRPTLNSLPFSFSAFVDGLTDEQRALLALECETLARGWLKVCAPFHFLSLYDSMIPMRNCCGAALLDSTLLSITGLLFFRFKYCCKRTPLTHTQVLAPLLTRPSFLALKRFLSAQGVRGPADSDVGRVFPAARDIYAWSRTPLGKVKVVILGQDPYPGAGQAHGLSFSVPPGVRVPASLENIYKELESEYRTDTEEGEKKFTPPKHGTLTPWTLPTAGVLLLNSVLTVTPNSPNSHQGKGWEAFTEGVLRAVDKWGGANLPHVGADGVRTEGTGGGVVVMAWGKAARERVAWMDQRKHLILTAAHPSPRSADRGFFGCGHFRAANKWLEERYGAGAGVEWGAL